VLLHRVHSTKKLKRVLLLNLSTFLPNPTASEQLILPAPALGFLPSSFRCSYMYFGRPWRHGFRSIWEFSFSARGLRTEQMAASEDFELKIELADDPPMTKRTIKARKPASKLVRASMTPTGLVGANVGGDVCRNLAMRSRGRGRCRRLA